MKNFYDATVTKPNLRLGINITLVPVEQCYCTTVVNGAILNMGVLTSPILLGTDIGLTSPINIEISIKRSQHPQAIIIKSITLDGYEIMPIYQNLATPPTGYLDVSGTWTFKIPSFYPWYHELTGQGWIA